VSREVDGLARFDTPLPPRHRAWSIGAREVRRFADVPPHLATHPRCDALSKLHPFSVSTAGAATERVFRTDGRE
jgi:hypothetical protein